MRASASNKPSRRSIAQSPTAGILSFDDTITSQFRKDGSTGKGVRDINRSDISDFFAKRDKAWQNHNAEALVATHAVDGEIESPLFGSLKGQRAIQKSYMEWFSTFPDTEFHCEHLLIDGDRTAQFIKITGTQQRDICGFPATGKRMQIHGTSLCFLNDGKIIREIRTYDFTGVLLQLGVLKAKPGF